MSNLSSFIPGASAPSVQYSNALQVMAGEAIAEKDLALMSALDGKAYRVRTTDYAAVSTVAYSTPQTSTATGMILAHTLVGGTGTFPSADRTTLVRGLDGSIYVLAYDTASAGARLFKYSPIGSLVGYVTVTGAGSPNNAYLLLLSNGSLACLFQYTSADIRYAVYNDSLDKVKIITPIADAASVSEQGFSACSLSTGGFALVYQQQANRLLSRLTTYDNSGTIVQAATTVWTRTGTTGEQFHRMAQLSNGNLVIAVSSTNSVSTIGLYHGVVTVAGGSVLAFTNIDTVNSSLSPELSVMSNGSSSGYAVARMNGANQLAFVFNNAGALQGASFTAVTSAGTSSSKSVLVNDGTAFWLIWQNSAITKVVLTKVPLTGTGYVTTSSIPSTWYNYYIDAFIENGTIVIAAQDGLNPTTPYIILVNAASGRYIGNAAFGSEPGYSSGYAQRVISGGDGVFICLYNQSSPANTALCAGKYANTAIIGVAAAAAAAGALVTLQQNAGAYVVNPIAGSLTKAFDTSATPQLYGNKGTLLSNGVVLKGM